MVERVKRQIFFMGTIENKGLLNSKAVGLHLFIGVCSMVLFVGSLLLILQPLFADGLALNADAGQAGAWTLLYRYGSIGVVGLWTACLLMPRRVVRRLPDVASFVLMGCVIWEAVVALNQLYGDGMSNHALYRFTGTFLNPGPFSGFLAIGVPLAVHYLVKSDKLRATSDELRATSGPFGASNIGAGRCVRLNTSGNCNQGRHIGLPLQMSHDSLVARSLSLVAIITLVLCLLLLPAGMSRSAWGAAIAGAAAVYGMHRWESVREWCGTLLQSRKGMMAVGATLVLCIGMGWGAFHLKKDSANGRLLMWKVACQAIAERPWTGYGAEGFPTAYAEAQERYFASGQGTEEEKHVAGTPEHAFNEYLTVAVRYGLLGLGVMLAIGITAFVCALRGQAYGVAGALVTVGVFAFSSYPFQLPDFLAAVMVVVVASSGSPKGGENKGNMAVSIYRRGIPCGCPDTHGLSLIGHPQGMPLRWLLIILAPLLYWGMKNAEIWQARYDAAKEWRNARSLYHMEAYSVVCEDYAPLYERMRWNHNYLFEYGRALHQMERYEESNRILQEAERICGDPMILNIQGKNYEALGTYDQAARLYQRAYNRLPNRLYPLYLEMEMYASSQCNRLDAAKEIARRILDTKEKIPSQAVEEMKERAREVMKMHRQGRHVSPLPMHYNFASLL